MERNSYLVIQESQHEIETRDEILWKREKALGELMAEHNEKFEKLRKGYVKLGVINEIQFEYSEPMILVKFQKEMELMQERFESINKNPKTIEEKNIFHNELEKYIADMIILYSRRWNTIISYKNLWRQERSELRKKELGLEKEYIALEKLDEKTSKSKWMELAENLFNKHIPLIEEQKKRLLLEEEQQNELESILKSREQLFKLAEQLFVL